MRIIHRLITASCGIHSADQASIVAVPIVASALFDASPEAIGVLVAAQSIAHLLGSIPFGLIVDKLPLKSAALLATIISFLAFCGVAVGVIYGSLLMFGITILVSSFGIVLYSLVVLSIVPIISKTDQLSETNARLEIPRSLAAFVIPLTIGVVAVQDASAVIFGLAAISALIAVMAIVQLPELPAFTRPKGSSFQLILEAGQYIFKHDLL
ncbi:MAG: MFS transporter, partial [Chloroflexota bacterium]